MNQDTWNKVMALKKAGELEQEGGANVLTDPQIEAILGTIDFFGGTYQLDYFDLSRNAKPFAPRYRVFDWLAMRVQGRHSGSEGDIQATKVLAYSFIKSGGVPSKFIQDLMETDYQIDTEWEKM